MIFYQIRSFFWFKATEKGIFPLLWNLKEADVKYFPEKVALGDFAASLSLFWSYIGRIVKLDGLFLLLCLDLGVDFPILSRLLLLQNS